MLSAHAISVYVPLLISGMQRRNLSSIGADKCQRNGQTLMAVHDYTIFRNARCALRCTIVHPVCAQHAMLKSGQSSLPGPRFVWRTTTNVGHRVANTDNLTGIRLSFVLLVAARHNCNHNKFNEIQGTEQGTSRTRLNRAHYLPGGFCLFWIVFVFYFSNALFIVIYVMYGVQSLLLPPINCCRFNASIYFSFHPVRMPCVPVGHTTTTHSSPVSHTRKPPHLPRPIRSSPSVGAVLMRFLCEANA